MIFEKIQSHAPRIKHQLGGKLTLGRREYRLRGYHTDRLAYEATEPHMLAAIERILHSRPGAFIDVGANVGQTLMKMLSIDPARRYFGFEPQPDCCFYMGRFIADNDLTNCHIVPIALSDSNGLFPLYSDKPNDDMASLLPSHTQRSERARTSWCQARVGDEALAELGVDHIAAIKIDVEGFELEVLEGLSETLRSRPPILFEVLTNYAWGKLVDDQTRTANSRRASRIHALLSDAGYTIERLDRSGVGHPIDGFDLDTLPPAEFGEGRDYLAQ